jgi:hypothetical protein
MGNAYKILDEKPEINGNLRAVFVNGRIILKWSL